MRPYMTRWATQFNQHPFQAVWKSLIETLDLTEVDDKTIPTSVDELARLKRVVVYIDTVLNSIDPDLTPSSIWDSFSPQAAACFEQIKAYSSNKNIAHIVQANAHIDNLLTYVKPYYILPKDGIKALQNSAKSYASELQEFLVAFHTKSESVLKTLEENSAHSTSLLSNSKSQAKEIDEFKKRLFVGTDEKDSIDTEINDIKISIIAKAKEIDALHDKLLIGEASTTINISEAEEAIVESKNKIEGWINTVSGQIKQLGVFHTKIYGEKDEITGEVASGLQYELNLRTSQLALLEKDQATKHQLLFNKIEALLPGATSAGLASSYKDLKDKFANPIKLYTMAFYGSLLLLVFAAVVMSIQKISFSPEIAIQFVEVKEWDYILKALLYKIPFIAPVLWLAIFSSTRRSQYERLQQEYAHKEALATSYESYKKQIQDLKGDSDELQKELISKAINAIAYNASVTLDGKHEDKMPMQQLLEKFSVDDMKKLVELVKKA